MGPIVSAAVRRRWLTLLGIAVVLIALIQPSRDLRPWLVLIGGALIVTQIVIGIAGTIRTQRASKTR
jgi:hypothetical protein